MTTSPIDPAKLREEVISDGEGDYTGLYEIVWSLNTQYPRLDPDLKVAAARAVVADLLRDGRVSLYRPAWASNRYYPVCPWRGTDFVPHPCAVRASRPQLKRDPLGSRNQESSCQPSSSGCSSSISASLSALVSTSTASLCPGGSARPLPKVSNGTLPRRVRTTRGEGSGASLQRAPSRFSRWHGRGLAQCGSRSRLVVGRRHNRPRRPTLHVLLFHSNDGEVDGRNRHCNCGGTCAAVGQSQLSASRTCLSSLAGIATSLRAVLCAVPVASGCLTCA